MKPLVVSVCTTAVTDMAAVSLLVFFCVIEHQKNTRRKNARRTQEEKNTRQPPLINPKWAA